MKTISILAAALVLGLVLAPIPAGAFGQEGCGAAPCNNCHSITVQEASELLKGLVDEVNSANFAEMPGLFVLEVTSRGKKGLLYLDFSKSFVVSGSVYNLETRQNVTQKKLMEMVRVDVGAIPLENSLILGKPKAKKRIFVFTDPQCPFCKKLHPELQEVVRKDPDVVFYIKLLPLVTIHPDSYRISRSILCEGKLSLLEKSFAGETIPDPACPSDAVDATIGLAQSLGVGSTPTMIMPDGRMVPGFKKADDILGLLSEKKP